MWTVATLGLELVEWRCEAGARALVAALPATNARLPASPHPRLAILLHMEFTGPWPKPVGYRAIGPGY